jgi:RNA polymerase sigma factor (sigma-70 family)
LVGGSSPPGSVMAKPNFKSMSEEEAKSFISDHIKKRFTKNGPILGKLPKDCREDALNEVYVDLWNNRFNYDPSLADFTTYAYNRGRGVVKSMLQSINRISKVRNKIVNDKNKPFFEIQAGYENKELLSKLLALLTEEERSIMQMRFVDSIHVDEIAKSMKLNPQKVYAIIREAKMKCIKSKWGLEF